MRRPKVKLDNLIALMTVAAKHNIDGAADQLGLSPSAVRKQIETVESTLGIHLFKNIRGTLSLTEDGEEFHEDAKKAVEQVLLAEEKVYARQSIKQHHLVIGHSTNLPPKLIGMIHRLGMNDRPQVRIHHKTGLTSTTIQGVMNGSLHAGFGILPIRVPELRVWPIYEEPLVACIPTSHELASKTVIYPQDLDGEPIIAISREPWPQRHQEIEDYFSGFGIGLDIVTDAFSAPEAMAYVTQKVGICLLPSTSIVVHSGITVRPLSTQVLKRRCGVFLREDNRSALLHILVEKVVNEVVSGRLKR